MNYIFNISLHFVTLCRSVHGKNLMRSRIVPCHVLINLFLAVGYIEWRIRNFSNWANLFFFAGFLFVTTKVVYITAMIFLQIILHSAVYIYDFHKFIMSSSSFHGFKTVQIYSTAIEDIVYKTLFTIILRNNIELNRALQWQNISKALENV